MNKFIFLVALSLSAMPTAHLSILSDSFNGDCGEKCPTSFEPICAANESGEQKTFGSDCTLKKVICQEGVAYNIVHEGVCEPESNAATMCQMEYAPICATNPITGERETFENGCQLGVTSCLGKLTYTDITQGACCPTSCTLNFAPVCGIHPETGEAKTFANECALGLESCHEKIKYSVTEGECKVVEEECPTSCDLQFNPVCGIHPVTGEAKTFANACALGLESCHEKIAYSDVAEGECKVVENECPTSCDLQFSPVCGIHPVTGETKTFANACALGLESCHEKIKYSVTEGECKVVENDCPNECDLQFSPVCATNPNTGEKSTHANACALRYKECEDKIKFTDVFDGDCNINEI